MLPTITRREWGWAWAVSALVVALACLPYLVGWALTPAGYHFTGLLINPIDGHSYLAKMGQGAAGGWLFRLPYTAEPHRPVFIFAYHLALGHLAPNASPLTLLWIYHLARVFFGLFLLMAVYGAAGLVTGDIWQRRLSLLLVALASGVGWLVGSGPDLTVPEALTFPSLMVNAHFGLTALLMLLVILGSTLASGHWGWWLAVAVASAGLAMIQPFALLTVGAAVAGWCIVSWLPERRLARMNLGRAALIALVALPFMLYYLWITRTNPHIGRWMAQNITPAPPAWQWLTAYGLLWPLAAAGAWRATQRRGPADVLLLTWTAGQLGLMLLPISLQRRLSTGLHLPLCFLAAVGWQQAVFPLLRGRVRRWLPAVLLLFAFLSNLLLMLAGVSAVLARNPYVLLSDAQWQAMGWLRENVTPETVVLADTELGTVVPAWGGGARVVYGHPFETLDAAAMRTAVNAFYAGRMPADEQSAFLERLGVQIIILQTDRYKLPPPPAFRPAWESGPVIIYRREGP